MATTYNPYADVRHVDLSFVFGVVSPEAAKQAQPQSSPQSAVSNIAQTTDEIEQMGDKYTTIEHNMWILDGTMQMYPGTQVGWQCNAISDYNRRFAAPPWLEFSFPQNQSSYGFTLIFDDTQPDNYPAEVITTTYGMDGQLIGTMTTRPDGYLHIISMPTLRYRRVKFKFLSTNIPQRRVRVCEVRFGIKYTYDRSTISEVIVRQSVSPWCDTLPSAEIDATIDNADQLYNMINPVGVYQYLQDGQYMLWTLTIDGHKIDMGRGYFTTAASDDGGLTATITFNDRLFVMSDMEYNDGAEGKWTLAEAIDALLAASKTEIEAVFDGDLAGAIIRKNIPARTKIREAIRLCAQAAMCTCYIDRLNRLHFVRPALQPPADQWGRDVQHADAQIKVGQLYNVVRLTRAEEIFEAKNIAIDDVERVYTLYNPLVVDGGAVAQWVLDWVQRRISYDVTVRGNPVLDLLDTVQIDDIYNINGHAILTQLDYTYNGGLACDAIAIR